MIPPVFRFKNADKSDEDIEEEKDKDKQNGNRLVTDRVSDEAESIVYKAIRQLLQERVEAPFIAVHDLDLDKSKILELIFPNIDWQKLKQEFDFIRIGPKFGIIVIEGKSSTFKRDFSEKDVSLPQRYKHGLDQLKAVDEFFRILQKCTGMNMSEEIPVRKILFASNLTRHRYYNWFVQLKLKNPLQGEMVKSQIGNVQGFYKVAPGVWN